MLAVALVAAVVTVLALRGDETVTPSGPAPTASPTTSESPTASPTRAPSSSPAEKPTQSVTSAVENMEPFFAAAARLDQQLQAAAAAINAIGPPWEQITSDVADRVRAADLEPVSGAIPAGLPHDLQEAVVLVLSDLASRRMAMESFTAV